MNRRELLLTGAALSMIGFKASAKSEETFMNQLSERTEDKIDGKRPVCPI